MNIYSLNDLKEYGNVYDDETIHVLFEDNAGAKIISQTIHNASPFTQYILLDKDSNSISRNLTLTKSIENYMKYKQINLWFHRLLERGRKCLNKEKRVEGFHF